VVRDAASFESVRTRWGIRGEVCPADLSSPGEVERLFRLLRPAVVFNALGYGVDREERDPRLAWWLNAGMPAAVGRNLVMHPPGAAWGGRRLIHLGTALEYGTVPGDLDETGPTAPSTLYGRSKLAGTLLLSRVARRHGLRAVTARLFTVFGAGEHPSRLLPSLVAAARSTEPIPLTEGKQQRDFLWVGDVADSLLKIGLTDGPPGEIVNLAAGELTSVRAFTEAAAAELGISRSRLQFGALPARPEEMTHLPVTVGRLTRLGGAAPRGSIARGLIVTAASPEGPVP
jgi:nucleoside-diphosphate-sugar epimerase